MYRLTVRILVAMCNKAFSLYCKGAMHYRVFFPLGAVSNVQGHLFCLSVLSDLPLLSGGD